VQRQLARNRCFSPRNEHHAYLLKGLVRCGGCGATYVGDPCHGKFYYRCYKRCKKVPSVLEGALNDAIKQAVSGLMTNPRMILEPLRQLDRAEAAAAEDRTRTALRLDKETRHLAAEEGRLLDAYRTGLITPGQLGEQLEKIRSRRSNLELERSTSAHSSAPALQAEKAVTEYCAEAASNLANLEQEGWRQLFQTLIEKATFYGDRIVIRGRIRLPALDNDGLPVSVEAPVLVRALGASQTN
jgi:hypothetical protein